ncbi:MAG TPA: hypothetical protein VKT70_04325 [Stellaceae bacterium]|nr:hypothetical protein [Stellaceae bacterium]
MATAPFLSASWYRISGLKPRLKEHAGVDRHRYRGRVWYVVRDGLGLRVHRLSLPAYLFVAQMDGKRTIDELWSAVVDETGDDAPTQDEIIHLLARLHDADLLHGGAPPDTGEIVERSQRQRVSRLKQLLLNPLSPKIPLVDPDAFLDYLLPLARGAFGWLGALVWFAVVSPAVILAGEHWSELSDNVTDRLLASENVLLLSLVYPVVKVLHELGHGAATKVYGGEVHELGVMLLMGMPTPYVDATAAAGFRSKWRRCVVGAAGMGIEVFVAALALYGWLAVEPGLWRSIFFNVMAIAGISTVIFNANPLMRYDGYYILADWIEIPNLSSRATQYWKFLADKHLFKIKATRPQASPGEVRWFIAYAPVATFYRLSVQLGIALYLAGHWFIVGLVLALWTMVTSIITPIYKAIRYLVADQRLRQKRLRALSLTIGVTAAAIGFLIFVPMPLHTMTEGVVWLPESAILRAGAGGFTERLLVSPETEIENGTKLVLLRDPELDAKVEAGRWRVAALEALYAAQQFDDRRKAEVTRFELDAARSELAKESEQQSHLIATSAASGRFVVAKAADLPGRFFHQGDVLGYVLPQTSSLIRVTVAQDDIDLVRHHLRGVTVKLADRLNETYPAMPVREIPAAGNELPSKALGIDGGGQSATDPADRQGRKSLARLFQLDLALGPEARAASFGARVYVRFDHEWEPLGYQLYRRLRQLLLTRLDA